METRTRQTRRVRHRGQGRGDVHGRRERPRGRRRRHRAERSRAGEVRGRLQALGVLARPREAPPAARGRPRRPEAPRRGRPGARMRTRRAGHRRRHQGRAAGDAVRLQSRGDPRAGRSQRPRKLRRRPDDAGSVLVRRRRLGGPGRVRARPERGRGARGGDHLLHGVPRKTRAFASKGDAGTGRRRADRREEVLLRRGGRDGIVRGRDDASAPGHGGGDGGDVLGRGE
mmetsp:Transcript_7175/g.29688  ORF Transcript_7175/g.29688 Transcript_7175/m.29688 type:complete len:228 (+) Transcript_7175:174-857(+)